MGENSLTEPESGLGDKRPMFLLVTGTSGAGKSTLAGALADSLGMVYLDADALQPRANIDKISHCHPLNDADRLPWLAMVRQSAEQMCVLQQADKNFTGQVGVVIACPALGREHRDILRGKVKPDHGEIPAYMQPPDLEVLPTYVIFIGGERDAFEESMATHKGHYMGPQTLDDQLKVLERPDAEEGVVVISRHDSLEEQVRKVKEFLSATKVNQSSASEKACTVAI